MQIKLFVTSVTTFPRGIEIIKLANRDDVDNRMIPPPVLEIQLKESHALFGKFKAGDSYYANLTPALDL